MPEQPSGVDELEPDVRLDPPEGRRGIVAPRLREGLIARPELIELLREGRDRMLTLVCAPAGYGKTTLLAQWQEADREDTPFVWISLDERDSDPIRLWTHVITALRGTNAHVGEGSLEALEGGPGAILDTVLPNLIEELAESPPLVVILEDWHAVRNPLCDATLGAFVEHASAAVQVVISSRSDPGLQVARLRAHGDLIEVRADDLRLSLAEATKLVRKAGVQLEPRDIERLTIRTEGWLAGFCLALLAVKRRPDPRRFVAEFSGTTRYVLDYLAGDVLSAVAPDVRDFLIKTSVLERFSPPLCDAVLETSGSAGMLAEAERANLFLVSLDEAGVEYRYHRLFAAMLRRELEATDPDAVPGLYTRASEWHEANGEPEESIGYAIAGRDVPRASRLLARHAEAYSTSGRLAALTAWLEALSWPEALADRRLALVRASMAGLCGQGRDDIEHWLTIAEAGLDDATPLGDGLGSLRAGVAFVRSAYLTRGVDTAAREASSALELEPPDSPWRGSLLAALGQALYLLGRPAEARDALDEARGLPGAPDRAAATALALSYLALTTLATGNAAGSAGLARSALSLLAERGLSSGTAAANPHLALGCALAEGPDLHGAIAQLELAVGLSAPAGNHWHAHALLRLASARHRVGDTAPAREALESARTVLDELPDKGMLGRLYRETEDDLLSRRRREGFLGDDLSESELRILSRLVDGHSITEVAHELWLSPNTVKTHRRSIYRKLGVVTRDELRERTDELRILERYIGDAAPALQAANVG